MAYRPKTLSRHRDGFPSPRDPLTNPEGAADPVQKRSRHRTGWPGTSHWFRMWCKGAWFHRLSEQHHAARDNTGKAKTALRFASDQWDQRHITRGKRHQSGENHKPAHFVFLLLVCKKDARPKTRGQRARCVWFKMRGFHPRGVSPAATSPQHRLRPVP